MEPDIGKFTEAVASATALELAKLIKIDYERTALRTTIVATIKLGRTIFATEARIGNGMLTPTQALTMAAPDLVRGLLRSVHEGNA